MIYLIGGAPRCGKSTLAVKMLKEKNISFIPGDSLRKFLQVDGEEYTEEFYELLWNKAVLFFGSLTKFNIDFVIEGIFITPERVDRLFSEYPNYAPLFKVAFLGQDTVTVEKKVEMMRQESGVTNYTNEWDDIRLKAFAEEIVIRGKNTKAEAEIYGLDYFNTAEGFNQQIQTVFDLLVRE